MTSPFPRGGGGGCPTGDGAPSTGLFADGEHRLAVRVYYEDTDFTGLVYHASHVRFLERGRSEFLRSAGVGHVGLATRDIAFAVVRLEFAFHRPARIDDALDVATRLVEARGARLRFDQTIRRGQEPVASARVEVACIDGAGRARRPPADLAAILATRLSPRAP